MTANQNFQKDENPEYLLSTLTDDTPPSSDEDEEESQKPPESEQKCKESLCKYEKEAMNRIMAIRDEVGRLAEEITQMEKAQLQEDFKRFEEALIQRTIQLDKVDTRDIDEVRDERKKAIMYVQDVFNLLDSRIK